MEQAHEDPLAYPTKQQLDKTVAYLTQLLGGNPQFVFQCQSNYVMIMYFCLEGLDVLGAADSLPEETKKRLTDYIYSLQLEGGGFSCSQLYRNNGYGLPHIVFTYSALNCLKILGDDLARLNKPALLESVRKCQQQDGSFSSFQNTDEADLRFVYAALSICRLLNSLESVDIEKSFAYIRSCYNPDGGFGLRPGCESHTGATYCAVSSCKLLGRIGELPTGDVLHFLVCRQTYNTQCPSLVGVQGRVGKLPDSCYSFWVGASICMLTGRNLLSKGVGNFLRICMTAGGSYSKFPESAKGDPVHTLHSLVGGKILRDQWQDLALERGLRQARSN